MVVLKTHNRILPRDIVLDTGEYRVGSAMSMKGQVMKGDYTVVVSLYDPGLMGEFYLHLISDHPSQLTRLSDFRARPE